MGEQPNHFSGLFHGALQRVSPHYFQTVYNSMDAIDMALYPFRYTVSSAVVFTRQVIEYYGTNFITSEVLMNRETVLNPCFLPATFCGQRFINYRKQ